MSLDIIMLWYWVFRLQWELWELYELSTTKLTAIPDKPTSAGLGAGLTNLANIGSSKQCLCNTFFKSQKSLPYGSFTMIGG